MIVVDFFKSEKNDNILVGYSLEGHAESGVFGKDIVCAAVSSAAYMTANTITEIMKINVSVLVDNEGKMLLNANLEEALKCQDILAGFRLHILELEKQYPENLKVSDVEV